MNEEELFAKIIDLKDAGKDKWQILAVLGNTPEVREALETDGAITHSGEGLFPNREILQSVIDEANKQTVTNNSPARLSIAEQARKNSSINTEKVSFIQSFNNFFMGKRIAFIGSGIASLLIIASVGFYLGFSKGNTISLVALETSVISQAELLQTELQELDSFLEEELDLNEDLLAFLAEEDVSVEELDTDIGSELDDLLDSLNELDEFDNGSFQDVDADLSELLS